MRYSLLILVVLSLCFNLFADNLSFSVNNFEAKTFNVMDDITINETPIIQIDVNTDAYITFRGMFDGKQVGKTLIILQSYSKDLEYHFICEDSNNKSIHSVTLDLYNKLIILDNDNDFIEVYYLELLH